MLKTEGMFALGQAVSAGSVKRATLNDRRCESCRHMKFWEEYGQQLSDCMEPTAGRSAWREHMLNWEINPAPYCSVFEESKHE